VAVDGVIQWAQEVVMDDAITGRINDLAHEEHQLLTKESDGNATEFDRLRLAAVKEQLDQSWDLLRQRRARRSAGLDPDGATARPIDTVEHYDDLPPARPG
jgi:hypothetical protein